jgi:hypothetical protein
VIAMAELESGMHCLGNRLGGTSRERWSEAAGTYRRENLVALGFLIFRGGDPG